MELEEISCILCGREENPVAVTDEGWQCRKCRNCSLMYISPRPVRAEVVELYAHREPATVDSSLAEYMRRRAKVSLRAIERHGGAGTVLELGPGYGLFLEEASRRGFLPKGIELDPARANLIRKLGFNCETEPLSSESFRGELFDVVYHADVISHLYDPVGDLQEVRRHVRPGGLMAFETGNLGDVAPRYYRVYSSFQFPDHLFSFSVGNFAPLLRRAGFRLLELKRYNQLPLLLAMKLLLPLPNERKPGQPIVSGRSSLKRRIGYPVMHFTRYGVGRILPKGSQPQTVVAVARAE
jgi:SAM-dependent methyltransferase